MRRSVILTALVCGLAACSADKNATPPPAPDPTACPGTTLSAGTTTNAPNVPSALSIVNGFQLQAIARVSGARELAALPNGDLIVGTGGTSVYLIPHADLDDGFYQPIKFATIDDAPAAGVAFDPSTCRVYVGTNHGVYSIAYTDGATTGTVSGPIALVRQENDGGHATTSLTVSGDKLYVSVGSSCNDCVESDKTRATVQVMNLDGSGMTTYAKRYRNAMAVTTNPATGAVWAGGAGQDELPLGHPYESFDPITLRGPGADYGWPDCNENRNDFGQGKNCTNVVVPRIAMPAYSTLIGAAFYPSNQTGAHVFPGSHRGSLFIGMHGSWHTDANGHLFSPPSVAWLQMNGDEPAIAVNWDDPHAQWNEFIGGFQNADGQSRVARPTGLAVGSQGSLFIADDGGGIVFRVRPN
jgi:glucose/arabinose dehydrogenase